LIAFIGVYQAIYWLLQYVNTKVRNVYEIVVFKGRIKSMWKA
jgi:hypothetical protein